MRESEIGLFLHNVICFPDTKNVVLIGDANRSTGIIQPSSNNDLYFEKLDCLLQSNAAKEGNMKMT